MGLRVSLWQAAVAFLRSAPPSFLMPLSEKVVGKGKGSGGINFLTATKIRRGFLLHFNMENRAAAIKEEKLICTKVQLGKSGASVGKLFGQVKKPVLSCQPKKVSFFRENNCSFFSTQEETTTRQPATEYGWQNEALKIRVGAKQDER